MPPTPDGLSRREALSALGLAAGAALGAPRLVEAAPIRTGTAVPGFRPSCIVTPAQTEGPYFVDEQLERADIRTDPTDNSVSQGLPLHLRFSVHRVDGETCTPLTGAHVDIWQCDAVGVYAGVKDTQDRFDTRDKKFLRGYQVTDARGAVNFVTIYPGWYAGRTPHIHFKVRLYVGNRKSYEFTSQLYFEEGVSDRIYARAPYAGRGERSTRNAQDGIYRNANGAELIMAVTEQADRCDGSFDIGLRIG